MKKTLLMSLILGVLFLGIYSFTAPKAVVKSFKAKSNIVTKKHRTLCNASITGFSVSPGYNSGSVTVSWTTSSSNYDHFTYGGYYNTATGSVGIPSTNTYSNSATIYTSGATSGRVGVLCTCADGSSSTGGATGNHGAYYTVGGGVSYF